eukprot:1447107-Alexandrium_andersonii.AAC.1
MVGRGADPMGTTAAMGHRVSQARTVMCVRWAAGCRTRAQLGGVPWLGLATLAPASSREHARRPAGATWKASPSGARATMRQQPSLQPVCCH